MDSVSNAMKLMLRAMPVCAALLAPALAHAQAVGTTGGALSGAFFGGASLARKATHDVLENLKFDNVATPQHEFAGKTSHPSVMPFIDGGYGRRRPAVGLDFSFDLGEAHCNPLASS